MQGRRRRGLLVVLHLGCLGLALSPAGVGAQPLDKAGQKCVNAGNKGLEKLMKTQGKLNASCAKNGATGKLATTIETCLTADAGGRVAKAQAANEAKVAKACVGAPAFGSADPTGAATGPIAVSAELALAHAIFGPDLDAAVVQKGLDPAGSACQATVVKLAQKCQDAKLKAFNQCKKTALKGSSSVPAVASAQALQDACLGSGTSPLPDPKGKIGKVCVTKLDNAAAKKCAGQPTATLFPGCGTDPLATCVDRSASCQTCLALNAVDGLARDCDAADDQAVNGSCECTPGAMEGCYSGPPGTAGVGTCSAGTRTCTPASTWGACTGEVTPVPESCIGLDDDCDGLVDLADPEC